MKELGPGRKSTAGAGPGDSSTTPAGRALAAACCLPPPRKQPAPASFCDCKRQVGSPWVARAHFAPLLHQHSSARCSEKKKNVPVNPPGPPPAARSSPQPPALTEGEGGQGRQLVKKPRAETAPPAPRAEGARRGAARRGLSSAPPAPARTRLLLSEGDGGEAAPRGSARHSTAKPEGFPVAGRRQKGFLRVTPMVPLSHATPACLVGALTTLAGSCSCCRVAFLPPWGHAQLLALCAGAAAALHPLSDGLSRDGDRAVLERGKDEKKPTTLSYRICFSAGPERGSSEVRARQGAGVGGPSPQGARTIPQAPRSR